MVSRQHPPRFAVLFVALGLSLATVLVYLNSFSGPFVFDDLRSITTNQSIQHLWPLSLPLSPPQGETVGGRPLVNLSLAINYAISGTDVWSYHAVNLLIHLLAGLTLFGVLRRTLLRTAFSEHALTLGAAIALLWLLHPLQTEAVTYVVQRAESMASLAYLLTLYCFIRSADARFRGWQAASIIACAAGMACKEIVVSAPLIVLLYDRAFVSGDFRTAWTMRRGYYLGLMGTWPLLGLLLLGHGRGTTAGFDSGVSVFAYAMTQARAVVHYLSLVVWPKPLVFDYGNKVDTVFTADLLCAVVVLGLVACVGWAIWRAPKLGFVGAAFFALLAPSSSVIPIATQTLAEHRMYLPLAAVLTLVVIGLHTVIGGRVLPLCAMGAILLGWRTVVRNQDYITAVALWTDTAAKLPTNSRAHHSLGKALAAEGRAAEALAEYQMAVRIEPTNSQAQNDLGVAYAQEHRLEEARSSFEQALASDPGFVEASFNEATALMDSGDFAAAAIQYQKTLALAPDYPGAHANLGRVDIRLGKLPEAAGELVAATRLAPDSVNLHVDLGHLLVLLNQQEAAAEQFRKALALDDHQAIIHNELGKTLARLGLLPQALDEFDAALRIDPSLAEATSNRALTRKLLDRGGR